MDISIKITSYIVLSYICNHSILFGKQFYRIDFVRLFSQFLANNQVLEKDIYFTATPLRWSTRKTLCFGKAHSAYVLIAVCASARDLNDTPRQAPRSGAANLSSQTNIFHHIQFQVFPKNANILL